MTRTEWQQLAERWLPAAKALLDAHQWSAAYYLAGYAVECGLKACVLARLATTPELIFDDRRFSDRCWTHNVEELVKLAGLEPARVAEASTNPSFGQNWYVVKDWSEAGPVQYSVAPTSQEALQRDRGQGERGDAMDPLPLINEQIEAGSRFLREFQKVIPLQSAFWVKEYDASDWFLYVASDEITDDNFDVLYGDVLRITMSRRDPQFDPFCVKLIGSDHRLAKKAAEVQRQFPGRSGYSDSWPPPPSTSTSTLLRFPFQRGESAYLVHLPISAARSIASTSRRAAGV